MLARVLSEPIPYRGNVVTAPKLMASPSWLEVFADMHLMEQRANVVGEIDDYFAFIFWIHVKNFVRSWRGLRLGYFEYVGTYLKGALGIEQERVRRKYFPRLCSEREKAHRFYQLCLNPHPTHALSEHLREAYCGYDWGNIDWAHEVRVSAIPIFGFGTTIPYVLVGLAALALFPDELSKRSGLELAYMWILLACILLPVLGFSVVLWTARNRARRAAYIFRYLAIPPGKERVSMATENCTVSATERVTRQGEKSRAERKSCR